jgi:hypothetical protein
MVNNNKMATQKIDLKLSALLEDLDNGLTWFKKEDVGYGNIQEKYEATEFHIKIIQKHPKLVNVQPNIKIFNIIDDVNGSDHDIDKTPIVVKSETTEEIIPAATLTTETETFFNL